MDADFFCIYMYRILAFIFIIDKIDLHAIMLLFVSIYSICSFVLLLFLFSSQYLE